MRPWRVLFVITSSDFGGSENLTRELTLRLPEEGPFETLVCSLEAPGRMADAVGAAGIRVESLEMSPRPRLRELVTGVFKLARLIDSLQVDLIQSCLYRANLLAAVAVRIARRRPRLVTAQHSLEPGRHGRLAGLAGRWAHRRSDRAVAISRPVQENLIRIDRVPRDRVVLIGGGIDTSRYRALDRGSARRGFGLSPEAIVAGAAGRLVPVKGFDLLLESAAMLRDQGIRLELLVSGAGPEKARLEDQARTLGLEAQARFVGYHGDVREIYAALDIFVLSSLREGSPTALLEAMASGCAIVATRVGGVPEMVEDTGLLVEAGSAPALAEALHRLASEAELRTRLSAEARRRAREQFDTSRMVESYRRLYGALLAGR